MKSIFKLTALLILLAPGLAFAQLTATNEMQQQFMQNIQNMSPAERNAMLDDVMKNTDAMESCIAEFGGMNALKDLQTYGEAHKKQVADLCKKDKRKQAQAYAQDASQEMLKDPRVVKLRDCSRMALQNMPELAALVETGGLSSDKHVCD